MDGTAGRRQRPCARVSGHIAPIVHAGLHSAGHPPPLRRYLPAGPVHKTLAMDDRALGRLGTGLGAITLVLAGITPGSVPDTFGHLAHGREIAQLGDVPRLDSWSMLSPPRIFLNYEWLSDLLMFWLDARFGYTSLIALKCAAVLCTALLLGRAARLLSGPRAELYAGLLLVAAMPLVQLRLTERPHVLGFGLAALTLCLAIERNGAQPRPYRNLSVSMLVHVAWVNVHGSHLLGLGIGLCFLLVSPGRRRLHGAALLLSVVACAVTPYGPAIVHDALHHVFDPRFRELVSEWQPWSDAHHPFYRLDLLLHAALLAFVLPQLWRSGPSARALVLVSLAMLGLGLRSVRFAADFQLFSAPAIAMGLAARWPVTARKPAWVAASLLGCALSFAGLHALRPERAFALGFVHHVFPIACADWLRDHLRETRLFSSMEDAWFSMYEAPQIRVLVDGRAPFYGADHLALATAALHVPAVFERLAHEQGLNAVILRHVWPEQRPLMEALRRHPAWTVAMLESEHILFVRRDARKLAEAMPDLSILEPYYRSEWIMAAEPARAEQISSALDTLRSQPNAAPYVAFVDGVLQLDALQLGGPEDGFKAPTTKAERAQIAQTLGALTEHRAALHGLRQVHLLTALLATLLERCAEADAALAQLHGEARERNLVMTLAELALRRGEAAGVKGLVESHAARLAVDPWLRQLQAELSAAPRCNDAP
jgi:hypothetical protein